MSIDNKALIQRFYDEVLHKRQFEYIDQVVSPSHSLHVPTVSGGAVGPEVYKQQWVLFITAFPDLRFTIDEMIAEGEKVACAWTMTGTHLGEFQGIAATGKKISVDGVTIHHVTNGKIMDSYGSLDMWGMMQQLGVASAAGQLQSASAR